MAKIKLQVPRGLRTGNKKKLAFHWWLTPEPARKASRLPQLNRKNQRLGITNYALRLREGSANPEGVS